MIWPAPESWKNAAKALIKKKTNQRLRKKKQQQSATDSKKKLRVREPVHEFQHNFFRDKFYQIIGHHYVMDLRHFSRHPVMDQSYTQVQFIGALGIDESQLNRWTSEATFVEADNFFAFQLLILQIPLNELRLSGNQVILERATLSALGLLARTYDKPVPAKLTRQELVFLIAVMGYMVAEPQAIFNPHEVKRKQENEAALTKLTEHFMNPRSSKSHEKPQNSFEQTKEAIRIMLTRWGVAYNLFALGYQAKWPKFGEEK